MLGGDGQSADVINRSRRTLSRRSRTPLHSWLSDHGCPDASKMAAASHSAREHDPAKERRSPGQRRSCVSRTLWVPAKVQDLLSVPLAALPRLGPRQGQSTSGYPDPGPSELWLKSGAYKARLLPRSTPPSRPEGSPPVSAGLGAWRAEHRPAPPRPAPARAQFRAGWRQRELTLTMETRSGLRRDGEELAVTSPPLIGLPVGVADILPAGAPNRFTCKNAALWMPLHRLFPRVTRGTFDPNTLETSLSPQLPSQCRATLFLQF